MNSSDSVTAVTDTHKLAVALENALRVERIASSQSIFLSPKQCSCEDLLHTKAQEESEIGKLVANFINSRKALSNALYRNLIEAREQASKASDEYILAILGVPAPATITLPDTFGMKAITDTVTSVTAISISHTHTTGTFRTSSHGGCAHSTRRFNVKDGVVEFESDIDY